MIALLSDAYQWFKNPFRDALILPSVQKKESVQVLPAGFGSFAEQLQHEQYALPAFYAQQRDDAQGLPFDVPSL